MDNLKKYLPIIVVFIFTFSIRIFWICQKDYVFVDEPVSFSIISPNTLYEGKLFKTSNCSIFNFKTNYEYTTKEIRTLLFNNGGDFKSLIKDLKSLYLNDYDGGHSNFYYMLLRVWAFKLDNVGIDTIKLYGCSFNILLFSITFFIMFKLLQLIVEEKKYIPYALFLSFISTASVSCTVFPRMYQLQTVGMLLVTYIFCKVYLWINENKNWDILNRKNIIIYSLALAFYLLTGYYSIIYTLILFIVLIFFAQKNIKFNRFNILKICSIIFLSMMFVLIVDRNYLNMSPEFVKASNDTFLNFNIFERELFAAFDLMQKTVFYPILMLYVLVLFLFSKKSTQENNFNLLILIIFTCSLIWSFIVLLISPVYGVRYFFPASSLLTFGFVYILQKFNFKHTIIFCSITMLLILIPNVRFNNFDTIRPFLFYVHDHNNFVFNNKANLPIVFKDYQLSFQTIILNTNDNQKVVFVEKIPNKDFLYKNFVLFFVEKNIEKYKRELYLNNIVDFACTKFYDCYAVIDNQ